MIVIRKMREEDIYDVIGLDQLAYNAYFRRMEGGSGTLPARTPLPLLTYLEALPEGAFVAEKSSGDVIGFVFNHVWGNTGWFGPLAVHPDYHGGGIGKELVRFSVEFQKKIGVSCIGVETIPDSGYLLGLFVKSGFVPYKLTFNLHRSFTREELVSMQDKSRESIYPEGIKISSRPGSDEGISLERVISAVKWISNEVREGFDYSKEVASSSRHETGRVILVEEARELMGFAHVLDYPLRDGYMHRADVKNIMLIPGAPERLKILSKLLQAVEIYAGRKKKSEIVLRCYSEDMECLEFLLRSGYQIGSALVRMVEKSCSYSYRKTELSRWAL